MERAHEAFFYVGLGEARYRKLGGYSLGMKQMVKLAQAIVHGPRLLFLDEPTNGLDPPARQRMLRVIREIRDRGDMHLVLSSHLLRDVEESCDQVLILRDGRIAGSCDLEEERKLNRHFLEMEVRGAEGDFVESLRDPRPLRPPGAPRRAPFRARSSRRGPAGSRRPAGAHPGR